ncbi:Conserved_hypothetical protein [Hexamita inflata]|uniref:Uncharacterized protein n=1 Tax=Hexamita inflata TaxID=28002 RepID=A0AA86NNP3_9EUKA|nr:Conserved hypothetical protein [Hexamita inflata]CAI9933481.1 Conserved hypothetical protein [Hexamita inflata]
MQRSFVQKSNQFKQLGQSTRKSANQALPDDLALLYSEQEKLTQEKLKIENQLTDIAVQIPQRLQQTADQLMGSLHEGALRGVLECVIIRSASKVPFGVDDVVQDLALAQQPTVQKELKMFLRQKIAELFEEDGFSQVQETCQQLSSDQGADVEDLNAFLSSREKMLSEILKTGQGRMQLKDRKMKLEKLLQSSTARFQKVQEMNLAQPEVYSASYDKCLDSLISFFREASQAGRLELMQLEQCSDAFQAAQFLAQLQKARNYLLVIFGINYGVVDTPEEQRQIVKAVEQFNHFTDELEPLSEMLQEFSTLIIENLPKLDKERHQAARELTEKITLFEKTLNDQITFCKERLEFIRRNENRTEELIKRAEKLKKSEKQLKKINYELKIVKQTIETITESDGEEILQEQIEYEKEKLQVQKISIDEVQKCEEAFVGMAQMFDGLSQCELMEMIMETAKSTEDAVNVFKMVNDE